LRTLRHQIETGLIAVKTGPLPRITSDGTAIEQIFANLLDNAIKYMDPQRPGQIEVTAEETAEETVFRVRDNGRGIAEDDMDKVFVPFRRLGAQDVPGEGVGLAFVRALLHRLGGKIECHSQLGVGTTFRFTLPKVR
jgi:signal transduction histidine kinase